MFTGVDSDSFTSMREPSLAIFYASVPADTRLMIDMRRSIGSSNFERALRQLEEESMSDLLLRKITVIVTFAVLSVVTAQAQDYQLDHNAGSQ